MLNNCRGSARYSSPDPAFYAGGMPDDLQPDAGSGNKSIKRATASFSSTSLRQPFYLREKLCPDDIHYDPGYKASPLAGGVALSPQVLILDEPIAQLDPRHARRIYETLKNMNREYGKTIIVIYNFVWNLNLSVVISPIKGYHYLLE